MVLDELPSIPEQSAKIVLARTSFSPDQDRAPQHVLYVIISHDEFLVNHLVKDRLILAFRHVGLDLV